MGKFDEMDMERSGQLRVLLVESDDSTSKIIAALLRKCSYQVTVVPDGLEAWDKLKGRPHDIDLILTEVELPSISGYALLSLIKEHFICKNIPVIMMSPKDSIPTVLKCMLKGAADFLTKPVRKNELRILWQHVWRKQTQDVGNDAQNATTLKNFDVTPEKHVGRSNRSDCPSSLERNNEFNSGANDLQGQAHMLTERASRLSNTRNHQVSVQKLASIETDATATMTNSGAESASCHEVCTLAFTKPHERHVYAISKAKYTEVEPGSHAEHSSVHDENCEVAETPTATDLICEFETSTEIYRHSSAINVTESPFTRLELSLRRSYPSCVEDAMGEDVRTLNHSKVSAFSRYDSSKMRHTTSPIFSNNLAVKHEGDIENASHDPVLYSFFFTNPKLCQQEDERSSNPTNSSNYSTSGVQNLENDFQPFCDTKNEDFIEDFDTEDDKLETIAAMGDYSETLGSGNLSNCDASEVNDATSANISRATLSESVNDNNVLAHDGSKETSSHLNSQREAALIKFRLKRKDRCYEKKVRYQSRKRLAEKRPRVKGQFVRQVQSELISVDAESFD